ncbi:glutathione synthetase [Saccharophagus sp. K07]|jgi:MtN3 and saliva related transmembrane protein|uniref:SemiSWEET family sugar transporter n=1 Tax=Saccharophagus sp. K07 TaxID=2283636 RepID=UPI00165286DB|nr:SemiSWEET transporter [Saccharophagus sp. K07]MBC6905226.1 glutathione synthetase [Saccharophagus sp. K07]
MSADVIGYIAAFFTTFSFAPQALLTLRSRDTRTLSLGMYGMFVAGVTVWLIYGVMRDDVIIIAANGITLLLSVPILSMKIYNLVWGNEKVNRNIIN